MGKNWIPEDKFVYGKGTKKFVKSRQCAAVFKKNGIRCSWYAKPNSIYCRRHGHQEGRPLTPERKEKFLAAPKKWWERIRTLEAQHPGILREIFKVEQVTETRRRRKQVKKDMPPPASEDPTILKAHKAIVAHVADLPAVPDKPFDELEPHEQLTVITGQSLKVVYEILKFPLTNSAGEVQLKVASMVKDTALRALAVRVKVDRNALNARRIDKMGELIARLKNGSDAKIIEG